MANSIGVLRRLLVLAIAVITLAVAPGASAATSSRLSGATRYDTAAAVAGAVRTGGGAVVVVNGTSFADALAATNFAHESGYHAPILLTGRDELSASTRAYLVDHRPQIAFVLGGPSVVSQHVADQLTALHISVSRYAGKDRYETARQGLYATYNFEAAPIGVVDGKQTVLLASGESFADALAAGPLSYAVNLPILLTGRDSLSQGVIDFTRQPQGATQFLAVGGTSAISEAVLDDLRGRGFTVRRIAGPSRQTTATAIADLLAQLGHPADHVVLARGDAFPDALAGAPLAGQDGVPILLTVDPAHLGADTETWLRAHADGVGSLVALGDETAVSAAVLRSAEAAAG